jgi:hypothetical protein
VSDWAALDRFLQTDPHDVGCERAMELLHIYVELVAKDADAADRYPGVAAHLAACGPCSEDFEGLLVLLAPPGSDPPVGEAPLAPRRSWRSTFLRK